MSTPLLLFLSSTPLACYFWVLAMWHGGRHPRLVKGSTDFMLLVFGVGGLLTFGPFGRAVVRRAFGEPGLAAWLAMMSMVCLAATFWGRRAARRLVIYHIEPETLDSVLGIALDLKSGHYHRILGGFEDRAGANALAVETSARLHYAVIEARGSDTERVLRELRQSLATELRSVSTGPSPVAWWLLALSAFTMLGTLAGYLFLQPRTAEWVRQVFDSLRGR
jgi:hypothetical protein